MNLPNKLTVLRFLLIPVLLFFVMHKYFVVSICLFLVISLTDFFDGFLARKYKLVTSLGALLDQLADKFLIISVFIAFLQLGFISFVNVIIIIFREFLVTSLRLVASQNNITISVDKSGKLKTLLQILTIFWILFMQIIKYQNFILQIIEKVLVIFMVCVTIFSCIRYFIKYFKYKNKGRL
jgi:CDP-diacylglycerol--glycerol-3-phosphate 3-phosphatidyltransferase